MSPGKIHRVKRQLLREAVAENLDTIRGLPPRAVRPLRRGAKVWLRRAPLLLVPLALVGATYFANGGAPLPPPPRPKIWSAAAMPPLSETQSGGTAAALQITPLVPMSTSVFPLSVRRVVID